MGAALPSSHCMDGSAALETSSPVQAGDEALNFGVAATDGKVIVRFDKLIQWFDMDPALAVAFSESLLRVAIEARDQLMAKREIILPRRK